jgi:hypothetical protein
MELEARIQGPAVRPQPTTTRLWGYPATIDPMQAFPDVEGENGAEGANCAAVSTSTTSLSRRIVSAGVIGVRGHVWLPASRGHVVESAPASCAGRLPIARVLADSFGRGSTRRRALDDPRNRPWEPSRCQAERGV